ncbi:MAG: hypothetical protein ACD_3C00088G0013 [uncultured bacterium (gcode 4)]|uniref:Uncharacterized protein n=1 Tax=uncultured bacterium (gcode 4) TaxID=1234023 RepID=K2G1S4_9BACT|nr:MAG: hypothetical protein ACD_3C00088G0013 [uncultured bacterium (gcode 4)]
MKSYIYWWKWRIDSIVRRDKKDYIIVFVILFIIKLVFSIDYQYVYDNWIKTSWTITDIRYPWRTWARIQIRYKAENTVFTNIARSDIFYPAKYPKNYGIWDKVDIYYLKENPNDFIVWKPAFHFWLTYIYSNIIDWMIFGVFMLFIYFIFNLTVKIFKLNETS